MRKQLHAPLLFLLCLLVQLVLLPAAQGAPGDFLYLWGAQQHLTDAAGVAVDVSGNVLVTKEDTVQVFNSSGIRTLKWGSYGSGNGQFSYPTGIAGGPGGKIFVADTGNDRMQVFDSNGVFLYKWSNPDWAVHPPIAVAVDGNGTVYVVEAGWYDPQWNYFEGTIKVFSSDGTFLRQLGSTGSGQGQYSRATGVAVDTNNNVYVLDMGNNRVLLFDAAGNFVKTAVSDTFISDGITVDRYGNIYVAGGIPYYFGVDIYDSTGALIREVPWFDELLDQEHYWEPKAVAVDANLNMYTLDYYDDGLRAFDSAGMQLPQWWTYGTGLGQLSTPLGIAVDGNGNVYETDGDNGDTPIINNRVQVFDAQGNPLARLVGRFCQTSGIALKGSNLYVLDTLDPTGAIGCDAFSVAEIFDLSGVLLGDFGAAIPYQMYFGIAVDKNGNFVVTDTGNSVLRVFDGNGNFVRFVGSPGTGNGQFINPKGIAIDATGYIYVVDANRVQVFDSSYGFVRKWGSQGSGDGQLLNPAGVAVDKTGHVYVADAGNNRVQVFSTIGSFLGKWGSAGDYDGQFINPQGIAVNKSGDKVYVADTGNNRIEAFSGFGAQYSLSGTVFQGNSSGPVLAGATVSIAGKTATTSSTGTFSITGIAPGTYTLTVSKSGYLTSTITDFVVNSDMSGLSLYLVGPYSLGGTVRQGGATGPVVPGATVSIAGLTTVTNSSGAFSIAGIPAGTYTLTISKPGYLTYNTGYTVSSNKSGLVFYLTPGYILTGTVRQFSNSGPVLAGATVSIAGRTTTTDSNGTFSITVPAGTFILTVSKSGYVTKTVSGFVVSGNMSGLDFYLTGPYSISGTVRQGSATGPALAGATVFVAGKSATSGTTGAFTISGLPPGTYTITISKTGYVTKNITGYVLNSSKSGLVFYLTRELVWAPL